LKRLQLKKRSKEEKMAKVGRGVEKKEKDVLSELAKAKEPYSEKGADALQKIKDGKREKGNRVGGCIKKGKTKGAKIQTAAHGGQEAIISFNSTRLWLPRQL